MHPVRVQIEGMVEDMVGSDPRTLSGVRLPQLS